MSGAAVEPLEHCVGRKMKATESTAIDALKSDYGTAKKPAPNQDNQRNEHMPTTRTELTENEVLYACAYWVECGCPEVKNSRTYLSIHKGSNDPREPSGDTVTASVQTQPR